LNGQFITLGQWTDRAESERRFDKLMSAWLANGRQVTELIIFDSLRSMPPGRQDQVAGLEAEHVTIQQLRDGYMAELKLRGEDWCQNNLPRHRLALDPLVMLFGNDLAGSFTAKKLKSVRRVMVETGTEQKDGAR
jgi:hypothetical protein